MSAASDVLREVAEALVEYHRALVEPFGAEAHVSVAGPQNDTAEDVLQSLPEHLQERITVTRVAPGRFVVEEAAPAFGRPVGTLVLQECLVCGYRATGWGALACGPHKREDGTLTAAVRMVPANPPAPGRLK